MEALADLVDAAADVDVRPSAEGWGDLAVACDLRAGMALAEATLLAARERRESRGCHDRTDFASLDPAMQVNLVVAAAGDGALSVTPAPVPPVPAELEAWLDDDPPADLAGRLLE